MNSISSFSIVILYYFCANYLKNNYPHYFKILTEIKVKFKFTDKDVVLENNGELIELNEIGDLKQIRFSTRLDYVPVLEKKN